MTPESILSWAASHPTEMLIWSHGFGWALALRRGRIERIIGRITPGDSESSDG